MKVGRFRKSQEGLQKAVDVGRWEKIFAAGDVGDLLGGVINDNREVIRGPDILAGQDDVAK